MSDMDAVIERRRGYLSTSSHRKFLDRRDGFSTSSPTLETTVIHRGHKRGIRRLSTGVPACCTCVRNLHPHFTRGFPQAPVEKKLGERAFECSHSDHASEGRPAATETALSLRTVLRTKGAVVSMPTAYPSLPTEPRTKLTDPMPLSVCIAEVIDELLTRES